MPQSSLRLYQDQTEPESYDSVDLNTSISDQLKFFPELRYMGSKKRLLPWIQGVLEGIDFETFLDPFSGSCSVPYLAKAMNRRIRTSDFLNLSSVVGKAIIENNSVHLDGPAIKRLLAKPNNTHDFIQQTFKGIFYSECDLKFLDRVSCNIQQLDNPFQQALARAALIRSCLKRQPRGVFTISGNLEKYDDGRRDLRLSIEEHFYEQVEVYNNAVFSNGKKNRSERNDVFEINSRGVDLVYLDPPYVPRSDDNCYVKRYHFIEGLSCYWQGLDIDYNTKVRKIPKKYTPFSYRREAIDAFSRLFVKFKNSKIVLSYSSNGYPDLETLIELLGRTKGDVRVFKRNHKYHFGTHSNVKRSSVVEYLIVGE